MRNAPVRQYRTPGRQLLLLATACLIAVLGVLPAPGLALDVPPYRGYVNDYAGMIGPETEARLERALAAFDRSDSTQIAVLTVATLAGDPIEDFSIRTVDAWKVGRKGKDNGVLFLVARDDHQMRIEVGRGLEGVLTDLVAGRIIDTVVAPRFRAGRIDEGFEAGVAAIIQVCRGEYAAEIGRRPLPRRGEPSPLFTYLFFGVALIAFLGNISRRLGMAGGALLLPLVALLGFSSPIGLLGLLLLMPVGALGGLVLPLILGGLLRGGGGFYMGGGGFGGGGFGGFGGGGFGGGGASGDW